jgi:DUF1680 family protein
MGFSRRMRPLPLSRVKLTDPFWTRWQKLMVEKTLPSQFDLLESTGSLGNFRIAAGLEKGGHKGMYFVDSDTYKWAEACAYCLTCLDSPKLRKLLDGVIETVIAAQMADGYLNTFFQAKHPDKRWKNLGALHEMYCAGHLMEAGVALYECLDDRRLLDASIRFADHIMSIFGAGKRLGYPGHEEIELGLIRLTDATGETKYREFARWLMDARGTRPAIYQEETVDPDAHMLAPWIKPVTPEEYVGDYSQDHAPIRKHNQVVGHAVRAMYLYTAAADLAGDVDDLPLEEALERCWANLTQRRMYVTGGIGPSASNEGFTADFDLPNLSAYAETCAAIGLIFWARRMLEMTANSEYADVMERALYNGAMAGISLDGVAYFYDNPLESRGRHARKPWFDCACCPPNLARLIGSLGQYGVGEAPEGLYIHQFFGFEAETEIKGTRVRITCESQFPWSGSLRLAVEPSQPVEFGIYVRIPEWSEDVSFELTDSDEEAEYENGYAVIRRIWRPGDAMTVDLGIEARWMEADSRVRDNLGRNVLARGPLVYCAESNDLGFSPQTFTADTEETIEERFENVLEGVTTITVQGVREVEESSDELYLPAGTTEVEACEAKFIPYFAWANRGPSEMQVWVRGA